MSYSSRELYLHLAQYNRRANAELFDALARLTDQARRRETGSYFGSIHSVLNHIIVADMHWLNRFKPIYPESVVLADPLLSPVELSWKHELREGFEELRQVRTFVDERIIAWFEECPVDRYGNRFEYIDSVGKVRNGLAGQGFEFMFVHEIHHRGQLSQVLDSLGMPNNIADNVAFLEGPGRQ